VMETPYFDDVVKAGDGGAGKSRSSVSSSD
jgi:hypothetical protein